MSIKNPTGWSNADAKNPTAFSNANTKSPSSWANANTKNPMAVTPEEKNETDWHDGIINNPGFLGLFANDLRILVSNDGRALVTAGYYPVSKTATNWTPIG